MQQHKYKECKSCTNNISHWRDVQSLTSKESWQYVAKQPNFYLTVLMALGNSLHHYKVHECDQLTSKNIGICYLVSCSSEFKLQPAHSLHLIITIKEYSCMFSCNQIFSLHKQQKLQTTCSLPCITEQILHNYSHACFYACFYGSKAFLNLVISCRRSYVAQYRCSLCGGCRRMVGSIVVSL